MSPYSGTVVVRTVDGTVLSKTPSGDDPNELATVELMS